MKFYFKAISANGLYRHGFIEAKTSQEVVAVLRNQKLLPLKIIEQHNSQLLQFRKKKKFNAKELIFFTRQISTMLDSGLTLMQSLRILSEQVTRPPAHEVVETIISDIEGGSSFSEAIKKHPDVFSPVYGSLIQAAEASGLLDKIMNRLASNIEKTYKLRAQVKGAFFYPAIVIFLMVVVSGIMVFFVIPQVNTLYVSLNVELPLSTRILLATSKIVAIFWPAILGVGIFALFIFRKWYKTPVGKLTVDYGILRLPLIGLITKNGIFTEFSRTLGLLIGSGTEVVQALQQVGIVVGNKVYENDIHVLAKRVEKGVTVGDAMSASTLFPSYLVQMVRVGEQTGKLDESLLRASEYYEDEVEQAIKKLTIAMEPAIMVVLGIGVGFLLISVITPIYKLTSSL